MSDLFHEKIPDAYIDKVFAVMALCPQHTFQILTKRPERMREYLAGASRPSLIGDALFDHFFVALPKIMLRSECNDYLDEHAWWPLPNVWLGVSCEDQAAANQRIPILYHIPAAVRWVSAEPLLGPISLRVACDFPGRNFGVRPIDWIVIGGESGAEARVCRIEWIRDLRDQCANLPVFVKQLGSNAHERDSFFGRRIVTNDHKGGNPDEWPEDLQVREYPPHVRTHDAL